MPGCAIGDACFAICTPHLHLHLLPCTSALAVTPVCKDSQKTTYGVGRNEVTQVTCDVDSDPRNVTFKWFFDDFDLRTELKSFTTNGTRSVASFSPSASSSSKAVTVSGTTSSQLTSDASSADVSLLEGKSTLTRVPDSLSGHRTRQSMYGKMICLAENAIGRQRDPCVFAIIPSSESMFVS